MSLYGNCHDYVLVLLNCCTESNTEVEDEYQKKFDAWADQERCGYFLIVFIYWV